MPTKYRVNAQKALHFYPFSAHLPTTTTNAVFRAQQQSPQHSQWLCFSELQKRSFPHEMWKQM